MRVNDEDDKSPKAQRLDERADRRSRILREQEAGKLDGNVGDPLPDADEVGDGGKAQP